jgi:ABC-type spermidine/putrescine transport system permease subunit I
MADAAQVTGTGEKSRANFSALLGLVPILLFLVVFLVGPIWVNLIESLKEPSGAQGLAQYGRIFFDSYYLTVIAQTLIFGFVVTALCILLGYPLGFAVARAQGAAKALLMLVVVTPLMVNVVVRSFGWMVILGGSGALNAGLRALGLPKLELMYNWTGVTIAMVHVLLPFMVLSIASTLEMLDRRIEEAAAVLGAPPARIFWHVTLPLSTEGIVTGSILVFTLAIGSFVTVLLLGKTSTMVLPLLIYQQLTTSSDWPFAAAMGITLLVIVSLTLWAQSWLHPRAMRAQR